MLFFVLQLAIAVGFQSDNLVIARFLGADQVPQYAVPMKLFMLIPSLLSFVIAPLWPAYGEAITRKDLPWVVRIFKRSLFASFGVSLFLTLFLLVFGDRILELWVGNDIQPNYVLLIGIGIWVMLLSLGNPISIFLNGANIILFQVICAILMAVGNICLSIFLVTRIGISGPVYGSIISWSLFSLLPSIFYISKLFKSWMSNLRGYENKSI